jgi:hypothetical protein
MKDINELLRAKESQLKELQTQVESLRLAARLLADESGAMEIPSERTPKPAASATAFSAPQPPSLQASSGKAWP